jgi:hypothetical protein
VNNGSRRQQWPNIWRYHPVVDWVKQRKSSPIFGHRSDSIAYLIGQSLQWPGWRLDDRVSVLSKGSVFFRHCVQNTSVTHLASYVMGTTRGVERKFTTSFSGFEIKNAWSCTSFLPHVFMSLCVVNHGTTSANTFLISSMLVYLIISVPAPRLIPLPGCISLIISNIWEVYL